MVNKLLILVLGMFLSNFAGLYCDYKFAKWTETHKRNIGILKWQKLSQDLFTKS